MGTNHAEGLDHQRIIIFAVHKGKGGSLYIYIYIGVVCFKFIHDFQFGPYEIRAIMVEVEIVFTAEDLQKCMVHGEDFRRKKENQGRGLSARRAEAGEVGAAEAWVGGRPAAFGEEPFFTLRRRANLR